MLESGIKSGAVIQLLGQAVGGAPVSLSALCKKVFDLAVKGDTAAMLAALQVILYCPVFACGLNHDGATSQ